MKKNFLIIILFVFTTLQIQAATNEIHPKKDGENEKLHHFYFGPDLFWLFFKLKAQNSYELRTDRFNAGGRIRYEYIEQKSLYFGADLFGSWGVEYSKLLYDNTEISHTVETSGYGELDLRLGYPFIFEDSSIIPFLGLGDYFTFKIASNYFVHWDYFFFSGGYRFKFDIHPTFSIGQNTKLFRVTSATLRANHHTVRLERDFNAWGCELSLPLIWSLDPNWSFQIEPYYLRFDFSSNQNILGSRFLFGYHF